MADMMGVANMGGPAVDFTPEFPTPTIERGATMAEAMKAMGHDMRSQPVTVEQARTTPKADPKTPRPRGTSTRSRALYAGDDKLCRLAATGAGVGRGVTPSAAADSGANATAAPVGRTARAKLLISLHLRRCVRSGIRRRARRLRL